MIQRNNLEQYDRFAKEWWKEGGRFNPLYHFNEPRFRYFDTFILSWTDLNVLDVGCGGGFASEFMAKRGAKVTGVDLSSRSLEEARAHSRGAGLEIDYRQGNACALPFGADRFDVVLCVDVLEHIPDVRKALSEIYRVLKPGGRFLFDTINRTFLSKIIMIWLLEDLLRIIPRGTHDSKMFIRPDELSEKLISTGFDNIDIKGLSISGRKKGSGKFEAKISSNMKVMYIGKAVKK